MDIYLSDPIFWGLAISGLLLTGISKSGFAGGAGVVAVPLLAQVMPVTEAVFLMLPLLIAMDIRAIQYYRKSISWPLLCSLLPAAVIGIAAGGLLLGKVSNDALLLALGAISIIFAAWGTLTPLIGQLGASIWLWGGFSGFTSTLVHAGGPPISMFFLSLKLTKSIWLATAACFFGVMNVIKVAPYILTGRWEVEWLALSLTLLPIALLGIAMGRKIQVRLDEAAFVKACRGLLCITGASLLYKALLV
jgi:uncharacterized membrane protein YfcA